MSLGVEGKVGVAVTQGHAVRCPGAAWAGGAELAGVPTASAPPLWTPPSQPRPTLAAAGCSEPGAGWLALRAGAGFPSGGQAPAVGSSRLSWRAGPCSGSKAGSEGALTPASSYLTPRPSPNLAS